MSSLGRVRRFERAVDEAAVDGTAVDGTAVDERYMNPRPECLPPHYLPPHLTVYPFPSIQALYAFLKLSLVAAA